MKRRIKKILVLGMCIVMVASTGIVANADSGSFKDLYIDYPTDNNYTSKISKTNSNSNAVVTLTKCQTSNHTGHYGKVRKDGATASGVVTITGVDTYKPHYSSSYAKSGTGYDFYAYTYSASAGMLLSGSWTP